MTSGYQDAWQQMKQRDQGTSPDTANCDIIVPILDQTAINRIHTQMNNSTDTFSKGTFHIANETFNAPVTDDSRKAYDGHEMLVMQSGSLDRLLNQKNRSVEGLSDRELNMPSVKF